MAAPSGTAPAIVCVHAPYGLRQTVTSAVKNGAQPVMPAPCDTPEGDILLESLFQIPLPQLSPDQNTFQYAARTTNTYVQTSLRGSGGSSLYDTGSYPYRMDLIDLGVRGIVGGVIGALTGGDPLDPLHFSFSTSYPAYFFSTDTIG